MATRDRAHIFVRRPALTEEYQRPPRDIKGKALVAPLDRPAHARGLSAELYAAEVEGLRRREQRPVLVQGAIDGIYVVFESFPGVQLALERLDPRQGKLHPELMSVRNVEVDGRTVQQAMVFIPDGTLGRFLKRLESYLATVSTDKPRNREFVDRIGQIGLASLPALWTDSASEYPASGVRMWWEVWLRRRDGHEEERFRAFAEKTRLRVAPRSLGFPDRMVVLVEATDRQLATALDVLDDLAELRRPHEPAEVLAEEAPVQQAEWVDQLAARTLPADEDAPAACIMDTGVHREHPLLVASLTEEDCHSYDPAWGVRDRDGHGTEMAGLALFGDLGSVIQSDSRVRLHHRLESVKFLPPRPAANPPALYGAVTAGAISLPEVQAPRRRRAFGMATTASQPGSSDGRPTSWSAAIDALAAGLSVEVTDQGVMFLDQGDESAHRLFVLAVGNIPVLEDMANDHLARSDVEPVEDPAQAWNALTVGAYTDRDSLGESGGYHGWTCVATRGELSPFSRTSVAFNRSWPVKPDVVLEGGNVACSPDRTQFDTPYALQLLTTKAPLLDPRLLTVTNGTSAATAQAVHLAASIFAAYPSIWPETVRALIVHSAEWTRAMRLRFDANDTRAGRLALYRRYGMGVPDVFRAIRSASDALVLVVQDVIHPFDGEGRMREMHVHELPWPTAVLSELGAVKVRLRVTLSYFIEPNPGRRGWARRYSYASHGLRFDLRRPTESTDDFRKRLNKKARDEEEHLTRADSDASQWFFGPDGRVWGSLHADIWEGTAADLASRGVVGVYPVTGWWKQRQERDHSERGARYALIVSIETPEADVDIWTPVAQQVGIPIDIQP